MNKKIIASTVVILFFIIIIILLFNNVSNQNITNEKIFYVQNELDDGRTFIAENSEDGYGDEYTEWATLQLSPTYSFGVRFEKVSVPRNASIIESYVELFSITYDDHKNISCTIYGDNTSDSLNFSVKGVLDICGRNYTKNKINWNGSIGVNPFHKWIKSPSISSIVQDIINRDDWIQNNSISILFVTNKKLGYSPTFANYNQGNPARLYIKWK